MVEALDLPADAQPAVVQPAEEQPAAVQTAVAQPAVAQTAVAQPASIPSREPITMKSLLEAGVHFGHQTRRWNPQMTR